MPLIGPLIMGGSSLLGGLFSGSAAEDAAAQQAAAMRYAADLQQKRYEQNVGYEQPYMGAGTKALNSLQDFMGLNGTGAQSGAMNNYQTSPFFTQMVKNAGDTTMAQFAGQGKMGGNALDALYKNNAGMWNDQYNQNLARLANMGNMGLSATNALAGVGSASAATQGQLIAGAGAAQGAGTMGMGNAIGGAINNAGLFGMLGYNSYQNQQNNPMYNINSYGGAPSYSDPFANMGGTA